MAVGTEAVVKHSKTRSLPLVLRFSLTSLQILLLPSTTRAHAVNLKAGLICFKPSTLAPPDPGGLSLATGFFFQVADLWGFSRETKGLNVFEVCRWRPQDGTLKKLPLGLKSLQPHLSRQTLRSAWQPFTRARIHPPPVPCPSTCWSARLARPDAVWRGIKSTAYEIDNMSWHKSKVMIFHQADNSAWMHKLCLVA